MNPIEKKQATPVTGQEISKKEKEPDSILTETAMKTQHIAGGEESKIHPTEYNGEGAEPIVGLTLDAQKMQELKETNKQLITRSLAKLGNPEFGRNIEWLQREKAWVRKQIMFVQRLHHNDYSGVYTIEIDRLATLFKDYEKAIDTKITQISRPSTPAIPIESKEAKNSSIEAKKVPYQKVLLKKVKESLNKAKWSIKLAKYTWPMTQLLGRRRRVDSQTLQALAKLLSSPEYQIAFQELIADDPIFEDISGLTLKDLFQDFLKSIRKQRKISLSLLKKGETIPGPEKINRLHHQCNVLSAVVAGVADGEVKGKLLNLIGGLGETAICRNDQLITDCIWPNALLYKNGRFDETIVDGKVSRTLDNYAAAQAKGPTQGFLKRDNSDLFERSAWENEELSSEGVFVKGTRFVEFLTNTQTKIRREATLDLTELGSLSREQTIVIFKLIRDAINIGRYDDPQFYDEFFHDNPHLNIDRNKLTPLIQTFILKLKNSYETALLLAGQQSS